MRKRLERAAALARALPGKISLYALYPETGDEVRLHADRPMEAASVIKLPIMVEAFHQREAGTFDFAMPVTIRREDKLPSCGALTYLHDGLTVQAGDLVTLMIILSDNTATNLLIDLLGQENINRTIASLGLTGTHLNRRLFDAEQAALGVQNHVTAADMGALLAGLWRGEIVSNAASREMLGILYNQRLNGKLPFYLHSRGIRCAHKTGEDDGITHDAGILDGDSPCVVCFLSNGTDVPRAERTIQDIGAILAGIF